LSTATGTEQFSRKDGDRFGLANQKGVKYVLGEDGEPLPILRKRLSTGLQKHLITQGVAVGDLSDYGAEIESLFRRKGVLSTSDSELGSVVEVMLSRTAGFESNPKIRRAIELQAMSKVRQYYERSGYVVKDVHKTKSYDFECSFKQQLTYVEIKGTRSEGESIALTSNELEFARANSNTALCVVHSIKVTGGETPKASGGNLQMYNNWSPDQHRLRPIAYTCRLSPRSGKHVPLK
jgi:hypothetical protein